MTFPDMFIMHLDPIHSRYPLLSPSGSRVPPLLPGSRLSFHVFFGGVFEPVNLIGLLIGAQVRGNLQ